MCVYVCVREEMVCVRERETDLEGASSDGRVEDAKGGASVVEARYEPVIYSTQFFSINPDFFVNWEACHGREKRSLISRWLT